MNIVWTKAPNSYTIGHWDYPQNHWVLKLPFFFIKRGKNPSGLPIGSARWGYVVIPLKNPASCSISYRLGTTRRHIYPFWDPLLVLDIVTRLHSPELNPIHVCLTIPCTVIDVVNTHSLFIEVAASKWIVNKEFKTIPNTTISRIIL